MLDVLKSEDQRVLVKDEEIKKKVEELFSKIVK